MPLWAIWSRRWNKFKQTAAPQTNHMFQLLLFLFLSLSPSPFPPCLPYVRLSISPPCLSTRLLFWTSFCEFTVNCTVSPSLRFQCCRWWRRCGEEEEPEEEEEEGEAELTGDAEVETPLPVLPSGSFGKTHSLVCVINVRLPLFRRLKVTVFFLILFHKCTTTWLYTIKQKYVTWLIIKHFPLLCLWSTVGIKWREEILQTLVSVRQDIRISENTFFNCYWHIVRIFFLTEMSGVI